MSHHSPAVQKWTEEEVEKLIGLIEGGASFGELVSRLGCTETELQQGASYLGVLLPKHESVPIATLTANSSPAHSEGSTIHLAPTVPLARSRDARE